MKTAIAASARPLHRGTDVYKVRIVRKDLTTGKQSIDITYCPKGRLASLGLVKQGKRYVLPQLAQL